MFLSLRLKRSAFIEKADLFGVCRRLAGFISNPNPKTYLYKHEIPLRRFKSMFLPWSISILPTLDHSPLPVAQDF